MSLTAYRCENLCKNNFQELNDILFYSTYFLLLIIFDSGVQFECEFSQFSFGRFKFGL